VTTAFSIAALVVSLGALAVSACAFVASMYRDRRDLLLKVAEYLFTADQQRGRRLIHEMAEAGTPVKDLGDEDYNLVNSALSTLNVVGIYCERHYISRPVVLRYWGATIARTHRDAETFLAHRLAQDGLAPWPQLDQLAEEAQARLDRVAAHERAATSESAPSRAEP
jgi:hypothetical protein